MKTTGHLNPIRVGDFGPQQVGRRHIKKNSMDCSEVIIQENLSGSTVSVMSNEEVLRCWMHKAANVRARWGAQELQRTLLSNAQTRSGEECLQPRGDEDYAVIDVRRAYFYTELLTDSWWGYLTKQLVHSKTVL